MAAWKEIELSARLFENINEAVLSNAHAALENCYINEAGGHSRFPGLKPFVTGLENSRVYLSDWRGDLIAGTQNGQLYRVDQDGTAENVTGVPIGGGKRMIFDKTPDQLLISAGAQIMAFAGETTQVLSEDAPLTTHAKYIGGYIVALEIGSGRFLYCDPGEFTVWNPLNILSAEGKPDNLIALDVNPFEEMVLCGDDSIEQFEQLANADTPFFRRWSTGQGLKAPYTLLATDKGTWGVNALSEFVQFSGQVAAPVSEDIGKKLEGITNWMDAWTVLVQIMGQKFVLLQVPYATNVYGSQGITSLYDYRQKKWFNLYGWDSSLNRPNRWPGWSHYYFWDRHFVGGEGEILELDENTHTWDGTTQRMYARTGHIRQWGEVEMQNLRLHVKRGVVGSNESDPQLWLRVCKDNEKWTRWRSKGLGLSGHRNFVLEFGPMGQAHTWQVEYFVADACDVEVIKMQALVGKVGY